MRIIRIFVLTILIISISTCSLAGDRGYLIVKDFETFLDQQQEIPIASQTKTWFTENRVKIENSYDKNRYFLIFMDKEEMYQVDVNAKTYARVHISKDLMNLSAKQSLKSEKLNATKKYGEWNCYGVKITTSSKDITTEGIYWLTKDVKIPYSLRSKIAKYFSISQIRLTEELAKYEGFPVFITLVIKEKDKETKVNTFVMEVKEIDIDDNIFKIPPDFKFVDMKPEGTGQDNKAGETQKEEDTNSKVIND